jgi:hypothetical protein
LFSTCQDTSPNASQTEANNCDVRWCLRMNTCFVHFWHNWYEQLPSNRSCFDLIVIDEEVLGAVDLGRIAGCKRSSARSNQSFRMIVLPFSLWIFREIS